MKKYLNIENFGRVLCKVWNVLAHIVFTYCVVFFVFLDEHRESLENIVKAGEEAGAQVSEVSDWVWLAVGFFGVSFSATCWDAIKRPWKINK